MSLLELRGALPMKMTGLDCNGADRERGEDPRSGDLLYWAGTADRSHMPSMPMPCNATKEWSRDNVSDAHVIQNRCHHH